MASMRLRYLGHSAVSLKFEEGGRQFELVIDPFLTGNPNEPVDIASVAPDYVLISHAHGDHWGDTETLARQHGATVIGTAEVADYAEGLGLKSHAMNLGGRHRFDFGAVKLVPAWHSSSFPDGTYGGMPAGLVIEAGGSRIYHAGDTALFSDMRLIGALGIDLALLPIGDNFTMGPDDALEAVKLIGPRAVMPIHYDTFPLIAQDAHAFKKRVESSTSATCTVLAPGEEHDLSPLRAGPS